MTSAAQILDRCEHADGCLLWTGATNSKGYGAVGSGKKGVTALAHRVVFAAAKGPIPSEMTVDHLCRNRLCQNVEHMELVTRAENSRRALEARTHCKHGHALEGENVRLKQSVDGYVRRICTECARASQRAWYARHRAA